MAKWKHEIELRDLFTEKEDFKSVKNAMNAIADRLESASFFIADPDLFENMRNLPEDDTLETANELISEIYDICDECGIWVE